MTPEDRDCGPQVEAGYTMIANELLEAIIRDLPFQLPGPIAIFLAVIRETYGYKRKTAKISNHRLSQLTGITDRSNLFRSRKKAIDSGLINVVTCDNKKMATYSINKKINKWKTLSPVTTSQKRCHQRQQTLSQVTTVCMLNKELNKREGENPPPAPKSETLTKKNRRQIPPDFLLTDDLKKIAEKLGVEGNQVEKIFAQFRDYHLARGSVMVDWIAAWRTWCRNETRFVKKAYPYKGDGAIVEPGGSHGVSERYKKIMEENRRREEYLKSGS